MQALASLAAALVVAGVGQAVAGWFLVCRFVAAAKMREPPVWPPISVLKPLHGNEPLLEQALASVCAQPYPELQLVCGVHDLADPAAAVVERLRVRFPRRDITLVADAAEHGENGKISNLINMLPTAKHDILLISDSDVHCGPDYLESIAEALATPKCGVVTTLYAGLPGSGTLAARLGATGITHYFLPGTLLARASGREDCLGATMALRRETLRAIGGFEALVHHLADDNILGQLVRAQGLRVRLAGSICATTVPEATLGALFQHELRWARTIRRLVPVQFAASTLQYPLAWAVVALLLSGAAPWAVLGLLLAWLVRALVAKGIDRRLGLVEKGLAAPAPVWLLPFREVLSLLVIGASYLGDRVEWRGRVLHTGLDSGECRSVSHGAGEQASTGHKICGDHSR
jgi:ceramide glucosyltransferase